MTFSGGTRLGVYEIAALIGVGGMGEVYRARDTKLKRDVAVKVLPGSFATDADRLARFQREAELLASLNHPNIAQIYGFDEAQTATALIMELVEGPTLAERIGQGPIPPDDALNIALQIADALEAAHDRQIIHRDLKPANIKLRGDGTVKVLDFGIAKALDARVASGPGAPALTIPALTQVGIVLGTPAYMSPEQARGNAADKRTDIWAFGCILFEMLTGQPAFGGEGVTPTLARVLERDADLDSLPTAVSPAVRRTIGLCLQRDLKKRPRDIGDIKLALTGAFDTAPPQIGPAAATTARAAVFKAGLWLMFATALLLVAGIASWGYFGSFGETRSTELALRYTIPLPREGEAQGLYFRHGLSPDGRYLAVSAVIEQRAGIYLRALDSLEWRLLPGTASADFFWSADGQSIAFFVDQQLKRISTAGGPVQDIASIGPGDFYLASGTWSSDDLIVFASPAGGGLMSVPADGGEPRALTTVEPGVQHAYPAFLPDGRHFVYTVTGGASPGIYLASLDDPDGRRLLADSSAAFFTPSAVDRGRGHLIFARDSRLMAQAFDPTGLELTGDAAMVAERALPANNGGVAAAASDNGILAHLGGRNRETDSRLFWFDRSGNALTALGPTGAPAAVALAPTGRAAAIVRRGPSGLFGNIRLLDLDRGLENPFTFDDEIPRNANVVWSPEGDRVAYSSTAAGTERIQVASTAAPSGVESVAGNGNRKIVTDWSLFGHLVYTELDPSNGADLKYLRMDGNAVDDRDAVVIRDDRFNTSFGKISPDGRWIAYVSDETGGSEIWVQEFPSGTGKRRVSAAETATGNTQQPRWSHDGSELFYITGAVGLATMMAASVNARAEPGASPVGEPRPLFPVRINSYASDQGTYFYDVSSDSQRFLIDVIEEGTEPALNVVTNWERTLPEGR